MKCKPWKWCYWLCSSMRRQPPHKTFTVSKVLLAKLPECFERSIGEPKGEVRQYRGNFGMHAHEYKEYLVVHRDEIDPRHDPLGHLIRDAPHWLALLLILGFIGFGLWLNSRNQD